jgi:hypothetical protein
VTKKIDTIDKLASSLRLMIPAEIRKSLEPGMAGSKIPTATVMASVVERLSAEFEDMVAYASDKEITAPRYLLAEFLTNGVKTKTAAMLGVSAQGLWSYEKRHAQLLRMLRKEFAVLTRQQLFALARAAEKKSER